jgi:hypothetical protein
VPRPEGFYWCRVVSGDPWVVAEWSNGRWWTTGSEVPSDDGFFEEVGERLEVPDSV